MTIYGADMPCNSLCDVIDVADFIVRLVRDGAEDGDYNLGLGKPTTVREVAELLRKRLQSTSEIKEGEGGGRPYLFNIGKAMQAGYRPSTAEEMIDRHIGRTGR